jgi:DNA-directed RNA polymerase subunit RPC12/RpoP
MSITVECECGSQFRLADKAASRTIRCKDCDEPIEVPERRREEEDEEPGFDEATFESYS